jgi:hypothetical protein
MKTIVPLCPLTGLERPLDSALALLGLELWPIAIRAKGEALGPKIATGKEPIGEAWGAERWTVVRLRAEFSRRPGRGVGVCLGPERGPGGTWLIDIEGDGQEAEASGAILFGGEAVASMGWGSVRGGHLLLRIDGARLVAILAKLAGCEVKRAGQPGVYKLPGLPDLELRIGGFKPDGSVKQLQSVVPPTPGTDGTPRAWNGVETIAVAPDAFYETLERLADEARPVTPPPARATVGGNGRASRGQTRKPPTDRVEAWLDAALRKAVVRIEGKVPGERRDAYRDEAYTLAGYLHYGIGYTEAELERAMTSALAIGVAPGDPVVATTVREAIEAGKARPLDLPPGLLGAGQDGHADTQGVATDGTAEFSNYRTEWPAIVEEGRGAVPPGRIPLRIDRLAADLNMLVGNWPKRVDDTLFYEAGDHSPVYLGSPSRLFAWIDRAAQVDWGKGRRFITQERFFEHLRMTVEAFDGIETTPHWPPLPRTFYMHRPLPEPTGTLEQFLGFFCPDSDEDRELIRAMILTLFWGGPSGARPAFLITGPDNDPERGRGTGKTKLVDILSEELAGGYTDVSPTDQIADVKTRLLSDGARQSRVVRLDNIKTLKFSWADLEGLITASEISGKALYKGEGRRPNTIVWCLTLNGASLSKDMAQRVVIIKLKRPAFSATWERDVRAFARGHRWEILADVRAILESEADPITPRTRWAAWEQEVLARTDMLTHCQDVIAARQGAVDDDDEDRDSVAEKFRENIRAKGYEPDECHVFIPSAVAARWLEEATGERRPTNRASRYILGLGIPEIRKSSDDGKRGWRWRGKNANPNGAADDPPWGPTPGAPSDGPHRY